MLNLLSTFGGKQFLPRLKQQIFGLAEDFWKDGSENLLGLVAHVPSVKPRAFAKASPLPSTAPQANGNAAARAHERAASLWHAGPGEISEKMWGDGFVTPGGQIIDEMLIAPLGLLKEMSVLDLSAGLGGRMRQIVDETSVYVTGLEPDAAIAERGMQLSNMAGKTKHAPIAHYDPAHLVLDRQYNCIIVRETFYRVPDKTGFFQTIAKHAKPKAQLAFTDYIVDAEHRDNPAVLAWQKHELLAKPLGLVEMAAAWAKFGFDLRVHEDLTDLYKTEVMIGVKRLMGFLASGIRPDKETGAAILRRIETWQYRLAAMNGGMKFYRFYGIRG